MCFIVGLPVDSQPVGKKFPSIQCPHCKSNIGLELPFGPCGANFKALGCDKVYIGSIPDPKKRKWLAQLSEYGKLLGIRKMQNFNTCEIEPKRSATESYVKVFKPMVNLPEPTMFQYEDILYSAKIPRKSQLLAFIDSCLHDTIVVMPTGTGKTLVGVC